MKSSELRPLLSTLIEMGEPALVAGPPGVGKTALVNEIVKRKGMDLITTHPVVSDPTDFRGLPGIVRNGDDAYAEFLAFGDLKRMKEARKPLVVFLDDVGQAAPAVQAACMQLVWARAINGHPISDEVRFIAATNRREDKAGVGGFISAFLDRFIGKFDYTFDLDDMMLWWGMQRSPELPSLVPAFAKLRPDLFGKFEANLSMEKSATPRSIAGLGRLMNKGFASLEVMRAAVGEKFAIEFHAFVQHVQDMPSIDEILRNPAKARVPGDDKPDVLYAVMAALAYATTPDNLPTITKYIRRVGREFAVVHMRDAVRRDVSLADSEAFEAWSDEYADILGNLQGDIDAATAAVA